MKRKIKQGKDTVCFNILGVGFLLIFSILCFIPFLLILSGSVSTQADIGNYGYSLIPKTISFEAYEAIFKNPDIILRAYSVTIFVTAVGTFFSLLFTSMAAYVLSSKEFAFRNQVSFFFYFTSIFGGGLVPWYIFMIKHLHMKNNILSMIMPILINVTYLLIMKSYMNSIPVSLFESAKLDGAGDFTIYLKIALPLAKPALATVGLFQALAYWNDWYNAMLFIDDEKLFPLQYFLHNIITKADFLKSAAAGQVAGSIKEIPTEPLKLAMTVVVTGPIILLYPFVQRFFVKGVTIGAVKE